MIRLLLVDDQPAVRFGLGMRLALEPDLLVVGEAGDGEAALQLARRLQPDIVLMDVEMPGMDGIAATAAMRSVAPEIVVIMLSLYDDTTIRSRAQAAGSYTFVAKQEPVEALLVAIRQAGATLEQCGIQRIVVRHEPEG